VVPTGLTEARRVRALEIRPTTVKGRKITHFHLGRQCGEFAITIPKDFGTKRLTWTLRANDHTSAVSFWGNSP
jgi:hypothetical protein